MEGTKDTVVKEMGAKPGLAEAYPDHSSFYHHINKLDNEEKDHYSDSEMYNARFTTNQHERHENRFSHSKRSEQAKYYNSVPFKLTLNPPLKVLDWLRMVIVKKSRQTTVSFILGLVMGITLTAMLFQHNFLIGKTQNKRHSSLREGFVFHTFPWEAKRDVEPKIYPDPLMKPEVDAAFQDVPDDINDQKVSIPDNVSDKREFRSGSKVFVGVITAEKFLSTRAVAVNSTWGSQVDKISFFTEKGSSEEYGISVINLDGVSDKEYPPQKKAFKMLKYMCQNHLDEFDWFIRADDDVYIRVENLKEFLGQIDSDKLIYMGQPGHGVPEVREKLGLNGHNFCMGGPSVIFNRKAMMQLCPHLDECMAEVVSGEEDVEIGRCVSSHLHIECTHAWETLKLFYHSYQEEYTEEKPFLGNLAENIHVQKAITLHHVKLPYIMYKIHRHYMSLLLNSSMQAISYLHQQAHALNSHLPLGKNREVSPGRIPPSPHKADKIPEVVTWNSFSVESLFSLSYATPSDDITNDCLADLKQIGETAIDVAIDHGAPHLTYSHLAGGYYRTDSLRGTDYLLDVYFSSKEEAKPDQIKRVHILRPLLDLKVTNMEEFDTNSQAVTMYIILALHQTATAATDLEDYMRKYYEPVGLQSSSGQHLKMKTILIVAMYGGKDVDTHESRDGLSPTVQDVVNWFRVKYPQSNIEAIPKADNVKNNDAGSLGYSHNVQQAYTKGTLHAIKQWDAKGKGIILLTSTNFSLSRALLETCASQSFLIPRQDSTESNSHAEGMQFYQPISFALYSPRDSYEADNAPTEDAGYWYLEEEKHDGALNLPICGPLDNFISVTNYMQSNPNQNVINWIYESVYNFKYSLQRVPDKNIINRHKR